MLILPKNAKLFVSLQKKEYLCTKFAQSIMYLATQSNRGHVSIVKADMRLCAM